MVATSNDGCDDKEHNRARATQIAEQARGTAGR